MIHGQHGYESHGAAPPPGPESLKEFLVRHEPELRRPMPLPASFELEGGGGGGGDSELGSIAERVYKSRRRFEQELGISAGGPEMDLLLDLFIAQSRGRNVSVATLCLASQTQFSAGLRCIYKLIQDGAVVRVPDPAEPGRYFVALSSRTHALVADLMRWMGRRLSP